MQYKKSIKYDYSASIIHDRLNRTYMVHVGSSYSYGMPTPTVFVLDGGGGHWTVPELLFESKRFIPALHHLLIADHS